MKTVTGTTGSRQMAQPKQVAEAKVILPVYDLQKQYSKISYLYVRKNKYQSLRKPNTIAVKRHPPPKTPCRRDRSIKYQTR